MKCGLKLGCIIIFLMKKDYRDNLEFFFIGIGRLYFLGIDVNFNVLFLFVEFLVF